VVDRARADPERAEYRALSGQGWLALLLAMLVWGTTAVAADRPNVAAASDLKFALEEIAGEFETKTGRGVSLTFGSSGNFYRQIRQGAPFELFLSADESFVRGLVESGLTRDAGAAYGIGRLVLFAPVGSALDVAGGLEALRGALAEGRIRRFAIANPEHAPYGRAAEQVLRRVGLWSDLEPRLVLGENVSQAAQFVLSGSADGGLIAYSLALAPLLGAKGEWTLIPAELHAPLRQRMVLLEHAGATATAFYDYLQSDAGRATLERYGFTLPEPAP